MINETFMVAILAMPHEQFTTILLPSQGQFMKCRSSTADKLPCECMDLSLMVHDCQYLVTPIFM